jgi:ATP-dependent DNA helicase RecQ
MTNNKRRFMITLESESDKIEGALKEFEGDYDIDEAWLMRIKFISEVAN